jgi:4-hydroxyphenylacetate 3-monooxygenase
MFYAGAQYVTRGYSYRNFGYDDAVASVDEFMSRYGVPQDDIKKLN